MKLVLTTIALVMIATPAMAYQTEIDPQKAEWMREGLARWNREVERMERREARERAAAIQADAEADATDQADGAIEPNYPPSNSGCLTAEQVASYARGAGFSGDAVTTMVHIVMEHESGGCPGAVYGGGPAYDGGPACGLTQLYPCPGREALDPATNMAYAYAKYQAAGGFSPWRH